MKKMIQSCVIALTLIISGVVAANGAGSQSMGQKKSAITKPSVLDFRINNAVKSNSRIAKPSNTEIQANTKRTWNLKDVDIRTLVREVSKATGKNFIVGPTVNADVTFITDEALTSDELYSAFLTVLRVYGFAAVNEGRMTKIVPQKDDELIAASVPTRNQSIPGHQMVVTTIRVNNYPVIDLVKTLKPLLPNYSYIQAYVPSNDLIVADHANHIAKLRDLIKRLDQPSTNKLMIFKLRYSNAETMAETLNDLVGNARTGRSSIITASQIPLKIVADVRTNSILVNGGSPEQHTELRDLLKRLDVYDNAQREVTEVFYLRYMPAETTAPILQGLINSYTAEEESLTGKKGIEGVTAGRGASTATTTPRSTTGQFNLVNPLSNYSGSSGGGGGGGLSSVTAYESEGPRSGSAGRNVQWEASTNSLIITTSIDLMHRIQNIIHKLDIRRPQVLIEVVVAQVSLERALEWGVEWGGSLQFNTRFPAVGALSSIGNDGKFRDGVIGNGISLAALHNDKLQVLIRAIKSDTDSNLLATPNLMTLDNEAALIKVGRKVSFAIGQIENNPTGGNPFTSFEREDVGLVLSVKTQITPNGAIRLQIQQELSQLLPADPARTFTAQNPDTAERFIQTTVMADDGQIIVLGGLLRQDWERTIAKVPVLGSIPGLGALFRSSSRKLRKENLMIFLRPVVLYDRNDVEMLTSGKYEFMRQQQLEFDRQRTQRIVTPALPNRSYRRELPKPFC